MPLFGHRRDSTIAERTDYNQTWACVTMNEECVRLVCPMNELKLNEVRHASDLLRFIQFSKEELNGIRAGGYKASLIQRGTLTEFSVILSVWANGIQNERDYHGSWEFKLKGYPWQAQGSEAVSSRLLIVSERHWKTRTNTQDVPRSAVFWATSTKRVGSL